MSRDGHGWQWVAWAAGAGGAGGEQEGLKYLTRTDFLLQFVWVPVKPEAQPQDAGGAQDEAGGESQEAERSREGRTRPTRRPPSSRRRSKPSR